MASNYEEMINQRYESELRARQAKIDAAHEQEAAAYQAQIEKAPQQYDKIRKQAYTSNALADRSRRESMANMGLSSAGGTSQTLSQRNRNTLLSTLGEATRQQQDYTDNINLALSNLNTKYNADSM